MIVAALWVGRQVRVKVKEEKARLVLLQVRHKMSGGFVEYGVRRSMAVAPGVEVVGSRDELVGCSFGEALERVRREGGRKEGVVVRLVGGQMVKIKTTWWLLGAEQHMYKRWRSEEHRERELERRQRKVAKIEVQELRAIVVGLPGGVSPQVTLGLWSGVQKVEAFYERETGKRGAVIISFGSRQDRKVAVEGGAVQGTFGVHKWSCLLRAAYSARSSSNMWHKIRTWHV